MSGHDVFTTHWVNPIYRTTMRVKIANTAERNLSETSLACFIFRRLVNLKSSELSKNTWKYKTSKRVTLIWLLLILLNIHYTVAAEIPIKYEVQIKSDNDFFIPSLNQDQYYTYGQKFMFRKQIDSNDEFLMTFDRLFKMRSGAHILTIELGQEAYTPGNPNAADYHQFDRPFAGWLYVSPSVSFIDKHRIITIGTDLGLLGPVSYSGKVQNYFHRRISHDKELSGWDYQIPNVLGINIFAGYIRPLANLKFAEVTSENMIKLGRQSTYLEMGGRIRIGRFNHHTNSVTYHTAMLNDEYKTEFYLDFSNHIRFVGYNATLNHDHNDEVEFAGRSVNNLQSHYSAGINIGLKRFASSFRYYLTGGDFSDIQGHSYGSVEITFRI